MDGYDYSYNIPADYNASTVDFTIDYEGASAISVSTTGDGAVALNPVGGVYSLPTPEANQEVALEITITPEPGAYSSRTLYKARFFRLGDVTLTDVTVGGLAIGEELVGALNDKDEMLVIDDYVFTSYPEIEARFLDGTTATGERVSASGTEAVYKFTGKSGDKIKEFNITVQGIHVYAKTDDDLERGIRFDSTYKQDNGVWNNGLFTVSPCNDGWGGSQFKLKGNQATTLTIPSDMVVKQLLIGGLADNYAPGKIVSITTNDGATVYLPSASSFLQNAANAYTLVVNVENHQAGAPFVINIEGGSQPVMWFDFVYEEFSLTTPVEVKGKSHTDLTGKNHAIVTIAFDRPVNDVEVSFNGQTVKADGGKPSLSFALWNMEYDKEYTFTIPAGAVKDSYGNTNAADITYTFTTGSASEPVEAISADRFKEVSTVDELRAAVESLKSTNSSADAAITVIYMHNGDYDLGTDALPVNKFYNVSFIGESEEGVLLHGLKSGISDPVFSTRYSTNIYMENFTLRNDFDFGGDCKGVAVAHTGGNLDVMKNVTLQSQQDTQVTGERGYYLNCTIYGKTDYICGGGDHFYDGCTFIMTADGGVIAAPSTPASLKHGYVLMNCEVKGAANYHLGRPWQNEPRSFFLNTKMTSLPNPDGWREMSNLPTHFFEYGSKDAAGNLIDLSVRRNSPSSTNSYSPILPEQYVGYFTVENVLGSSDSWLATELTATLEAPVAEIKGNVLSWNAVPKAAGYIVYADGEMVGYTPGTSFDTTAGRAVASEYTVRAINANGGKGEMSAVAKDTTTGIDSIGADADANAPAEYYNLQGIRVENPANGVYIRKQGNKVTKVVL